MPTCAHQPQPDAPQSLLKPERVQKLQKADQGGIERGMLSPAASCVHFGFGGPARVARANAPGPADFLGFPRGRPREGDAFTKTSCERIKGPL